MAVLQMPLERLYAFVVTVIAVFFHRKKRDRHARRHGANRPEAIPLKELVGLLHERLLEVGDIRGAEALLRRMEFPVVRRDGSEGNTHTIEFALPTLQVA